VRAFIARVGNRSVELGSTNAGGRAKDPATTSISPLKGPAGISMCTAAAPPDEMLVGIMQLVVLKVLPF